MTLIFYQVFRHGLNHHSHYRNKTLIEISEGRHHTLITVAAPLMPNIFNILWRISDHVAKIDPPFSCASTLCQRAFTVSSASLTCPNEEHPLTKIPTWLPVSILNLAYVANVLPHAPNIAWYQTMPNVPLQRRLIWREGWSSNFLARRAAFTRARRQNYLITHLHKGSFIETKYITRDSIMRNMKWHIVTWFKTNVTINNSTSTGWIHKSLIEITFNSKEQEILKYGLQNGKTADEVKQAIINLRSGYIPPKSDAITEPTTTAKKIEVKKGVKGNWFTRLFGWFK